MKPSVDLGISKMMVLALDNGFEPLNHSYIPPYSDAGKSLLGYNYLVITTGFLVVL